MFYSAIAYENLCQKPLPELCTRPISRPIVYPDTSPLDLVGAHHTPDQVSLPGVQDEVRNREDSGGPFLGLTLVTGIYTCFMVVRNILRDSGVARSDFLAAPSIFATRTTDFTLPQG